MITKPALPRFLKVLKYFIKNKRTLIHLKYNYRYRVACSPSIGSDKITDVISNIPWKKKER